MKLTRIAAARVVNPPESKNLTSEVVLFTLTVSGTKAGTFPIKIIATYIYNPTAGWGEIDKPATGGYSDLLIGTNAVGSADEFPVRLDDADVNNTTYVQNGSVIIPPPDDEVDTDGDGVTDVDELAAGTSSTNVDSDRDGYSDSQEITNGTNPLEKDAAGGIGYDVTLDARESNLDVDGDGEVNMPTDGLMMIRYAFGYTDEKLIQNAVGSGCTRCELEPILKYLELLMPSEQ
jgi:hypothetical protein